MQMSGTGGDSLQRGTSPFNSAPHERESDMSKRSSKLYLRLLTFKLHTEDVISNKYFRQ